MELFTLDDFSVFDLTGFNERMSAIRTAIRPKLGAMGEELATKIGRMVDTPLFVHVARHARRTVNAPDDTWAALAGNPRGYKKDVHFKLAISRNCFRFLFEVGPEYYAKPEWAAGWNAQFKQLGQSLRGNKNLAWFKNEHDETAAATLSSLSPGDIKKLGEELTRRKDGQLVMGTRIDAADFVDMTAKQVEKAALDTFKPLAPLFQLHDVRVLA